MNCIVCFEDFNKSSRKNISCNYCNTAVCKSCVEKYIETAETIEIKCVNPECKQVWTDDFISDKMTKKFYDTKYRERKSNFLFDLEKSFIPETQRIIEEDLAKEKMNRLIKEKRSQINTLLVEIYDIQYQYKEKHLFKQKKSEYIFKCPANDCKGYISDCGVCGLCDTKSCVKCMEIVESEDHECDENILKNIECLKDSTKPCPKCSTPIHKIDGCDQMFCTVCHIAFSWKTLAIETSHIHNPHYYQWLRENGQVVPRDPNDNPLANEINNMIHNQVNYGNMVFPNATRFINKLVTDYGNCDLTNAALKVHRVANHYVFYNNTNNATGFDMNYAARKKFLMNEMSESEFKKNIYKKTKAEHKKIEINQIIETFVTTAINNINYIYAIRKITFKELDEFMQNMKDSVDFTNTALESIRLRYGGVVHKIDIS